MLKQAFTELSVKKLLPLVKELKLFIKMKQSNSTRCTHSWRSLSIKASQPSLNKVVWRQRQTSEQQKNTHHIQSKMNVSDSIQEAKPSLSSLTPHLNLAKEEVKPLAQHMNQELRSLLINKQQKKKTLQSTWIKKKSRSYFKKRKKKQIKFFLNILQRKNKKMKQCQTWKNLFKLKKKMQQMQFNNQVTNQVNQN
ncbi:hypothetical protein TTHERM_00227190 (macronuclear) [Tetrahymena thermophila SB210]|uniref:Uncharacterized protein n=1 Tax=Tetrahymena thermophila (strain SB210) TaxID=312017 RepID=Q23BW3_TETTS|nr:hypothetical protein TTHERM_00227190 [Tetrahymena thermophila SB210]EAR94005.2 hypothetical protein TTHERM_00227190 [Tetrahymena thermophila SB210]|eukprot:XP_001014250.2 hypothetical protein TTHERM_00227190 [Tetrahymena thermophila SB210]